MTVTIENYDELFFITQTPVSIPHREISIIIPDEIAKELLEINDRYLGIQDKLEEYFKKGQSKGLF